MEGFIKRMGADLSFPTIVAFGANASMPHHVTDNTKLTPNNFVLLDFGVLAHNYCSDMTRTVFFGTPTDQQIKIYNTVLESCKKAYEYISNAKRPTGHNADKIARDYIIKHGFPSIPHSLGHGIGIEVHEAPRLTPVSKE